MMFYANAVIAQTQSKASIILLANNFVAIIHLCEYNKYRFYTFMLKALAKKVCSVSFVSQYSDDFIRVYIHVYCDIDTYFCASL